MSAPWEMPTDGMAEWLAQSRSINIVKAGEKWCLRDATSWTLTAPQASCASIGRR